MTEHSRPLRVLHITDPHLHARDSERLRGVDTNESFRRTVAAVLGEQPDLLLATGDLVQDDSREGYERFHEALAGCGVPVLVVPGNHDVPGFLSAVLDQAPFQLGGHLDRGGWRIVMLDSYAEGDAAGELSAAELAQLQAALAGAPGPVLVALHHHPVAMGSRWLDRVGLRNAGELFDCIERYPQVRALLWGHVHQAWDSQQGTLRLLATPSTCAQFRPQSDSFALDDRPPAYRRLLLHADGRLDTEVVWLS
jgi:Icc protein